MWVIGGSGVYYVIFPAHTSPNWDDPMEHLNAFQAVEDNRADVEGKAQVNAGKGLYNKLDLVPDGTMVMVLPDDGTGYLLTTFGLVVPPRPVMLYHQINGAGHIGGMLYADIPLKSAAFW